MAQLLAREAGRLGPALGVRLEVPEMGMELDEGRHDRLAGQVDPHRACWERELSFPADAQDPVVLDDEGGALQRGARFTADETRALEQRHGGAGLSCHRTGIRDERTGDGDDQRE